MSDPTMSDPSTPDSRTPPPAVVPSGCSPLLRLTDFGFTYRGAETPALQSVDLVLRPGDAVAVLGPQGAGTSTLARAAAGLLGEHGQSTGVREVAKDRVGMLGDDPEAQLTGLTGTVEDEAALPGRLLGLPLKDCLERAEASLQALGIAALAQRQLTTLSGGERQLTALAGLLTLRPSVLVLDQPSQALDAGARRRLARSLRAFRDAGGAVLLTGHQHDDLTADCDRVLFLDQSRPATDAKEERSAPDRVTEQPGQGEPAQPDLAEPDQPDQASGRPDQRPQDELRLDPARLDRHGIWDVRRAPSRPAPQPAPTTQPAPSRQSAPARHPEAASNPAPEPSRDAATGRNTDVQLHVQGLSVTRGDRPVLQDLGLELRAGEVTALLGANGSGKSTLLGALAGLLPVAPGAQITGPRGVELAGPRRMSGPLIWPGWARTPGTSSPPPRCARSCCVRHRWAPAGVGCAGRIVSAPGLSEN